MIDQATMTEPVGMKLIEALRIANAPQEGPPFQVLLACGSTPLHLETAVKAHLRLRLPGRTITVRTGLYGDLAGTLENIREPLNAVFVVLEWGDLDPRLSWRSPGVVDREILNDARGRLSRIEKAIASLAATTPVALSLPTLPLAPVFHTSGGELNSIEAGLWAMVYELAATTPATVLRLDACGRGQAHDLRTELANGFPYAMPHATALAEGLARAASPAAAKKGLITDLDETLWSGILGDDGIDGIAWGLEQKAYFHTLYQNLLNVLAEAGILVGVASKNDAELVTKAFTREDLVVKPAHLFPVEANWGPKAESISRILEAWNINADSVVFVDDNPLELEQVKRAFPAMECLEFRPADPAFLTALRDRFAKREVREEDRLRAASLRNGQVVRQAAANGANLESLLEGAESKMTLRWTKQPLDPRALELVNKTNQFNLNGARYTESDWQAYMADPATHLMVVEYEDRFGKLGKIAILAGREQDGAFDVDVWVMSCRAFSRRIEHACLKTLLDRWELVRFKWKGTERNGPTRDFLAQMVPGFDAITRVEFQDRCPALFHKTESVGA